MTFRAPALAVAALAALLLPVEAGAAQRPMAWAGSTAQPTQAPVRAGYTRTRFEIPITIHPGANINKLTTQVPKPPGDFYLVRMSPNLVLQDGDRNPANDRVPRTDIIHLHHMVWVDSGNRAPGDSFKLPFGAGEEKTIITLPDGYGYPVYADQRWIINDMIHNLTPVEVKAKIIYDLDWTPMTSAVGQTLKAAWPLWLDVQRGQGYPVFDTFSGTGTGGAVTYPDQFRNPYPGLGWNRNEWSSSSAMTLLGTAGHVHPGGLYTDLQVVRNGLGVPTSPQPGSYPNSARLFRSRAVYYDPAGPVSWDMSMQATPPNWRVRLQPGDKLVISAAYDTRRADWYESMGIMVLWVEVNGSDGVDPFVDPVPWDQGRVTHGSYPENKNYGGKLVTLNDPRRLPGGRTPANRTITIKDFVYQYGDLSLDGARARPPVIRRGESLTFFNADAGPRAALRDIYHSITDCRAPCNRDTGLSYPLANGPRTFDSGQLGFGWTVPGTAAAQRRSWSTPKDLTPGTYTYFCRVHPFMRGAFRVR